MLPWIRGVRFSYKWEYGNLQWSSAGCYVPQRVSVFAYCAYAISLVYCGCRTYRPQGSTNLLRKSGQRTDGCVVCPRGRYGSSTGLTLSTCTAPCPLGTYGGNTGLSSPLQCTPCPPGKFNSIAGIRTEQECQRCPNGKYSSRTGLTNSGQCLTCAKGYPGWQCDWPILTKAPRNY